MSWIKVLRRTAFIASAVVVMAVGGYWGAIHWIDFNRYKPQLERLAQQQLGVPLKINGEIRAQAFPLTVTFHQIAVRQPTQTVQVAQVAIELSVWQLFTQRKMAVTALFLQAPKLTLVLNSAQEKQASMSASQAALASVFGAGWQWQQTAVTPASPPSAFSEAKKMSQWLAGGRLAQVEVSQGAITLKTAKGKLVRQLKQIHFLALEAQWDQPFPFVLDGVDEQPVSKEAAGLRQNIHLEGKMQWEAEHGKGALINLQGVSESRLAALPDLAPLRIQWACKQLQWSPASQSLRWQGLNIQALEGAVTSSGEGYYGQQAHWTGQLQLEHFNPREWARHTHLSLPHFVHPQALTQLSGQFVWTLTPTSWSMKQIDLQWDKSHIQGEMGQQQTTGVSPLKLHFALKMDQLDLDFYRAYTQHAPAKPAVQKMPKNARIPSPEKNLPEKEMYYLPLAVPVSTLRALEAQGVLQIGTLAVKGLKLSDVETRVEANQGRLLFAPFDAQLYGGSWQSKLWLDVNGATPAYGWQGRIKRVNFTQLLADTQMPWAIKGELNSFYRLQSEGSNREAILGHLTGHLRLEWVKGALLGGDVNQLIAGQNLTAPKAETYFHQLLLEGPVQAGIYQAKTIQLKAPRFQAIGYGRLNLLKETLALNLKARLVNPPKAEYAHAVLPIKIQGAWQKLQWSVPLKPLLESPENQKVILQKLQGLLDRL